MENSEASMTNYWKILRRFILFTLMIILYAYLYFSLTNFKLPLIEIRNKCDSSQDSAQGTCKRIFDVPTYFEDIKKEIGEINQNQTMIERIAGASPEFFQYSIKFIDKSSFVFWIGQQTKELQPSKNLRGQCPFPRGFKENENGGSYSENFGFSKIGEKLEELATALNDCGQPSLRLPSGTTQVERIEKYETVVRFSGLSHVVLIFLSAFLTSIILGVTEKLYRFSEKGFSETS